RRCAGRRPKPAPCSEAPAPTRTRRPCRARRAATLFHPPLTSADGGGGAWAMVEIFDAGYARKGRKAFRLRARMRGSRALQLATKRLFDIAGSLILFVMLWPLLI